jgi:hypothetical protein
MQRWKEEFVGNTERKCVQINKNGVFDQGKGMISYVSVSVSNPNSNLSFVWHLILSVLYMEPDWDILDLLNAASLRLDMVPAAKRVFNPDGKFQVRFLCMNFLVIAEEFCFAAPIF